MAMAAIRRWEEVGRQSTKRYGGSVKGITRIKCKNERGGVYSTVRVEGRRRRRQKKRSSGTKHALTSMRPCVL